jgi:hypothetical protein
MWGDAALDFKMFLTCPSFFNGFLKFSSNHLEMVTNNVSFLVSVVLPLAAFLFQLSTCQFALLALWPIRYSTAALGLIRIYFALSSIHIPCFQLVDVFLFPLSSGVESSSRCIWIAASVAHNALHWQQKKSASVDILKQLHYFPSYCI